MTVEIFKRINRRMLQVAALVIIVAAIVVCCFIYFDIKGELDQTMVELEINKQMLSESKEVEVDELAVLAQTSLLDKELSSINRKVMYENGALGLLVEFYYLLNEYKLSGKSVSIGNIIEGEKYDYLSVSFDVTGNKRDIYDFVERVDNYEKEICFGSIQFKSVGADLFQSVMKIKIYLFKGSYDHNQFTQYDFMEGTYGESRNWQDIFKQLNEIKN